MSVYAEYRKLVSVRSTYLYAIGAFVVAGLGSLSYFKGADSRDLAQPFSDLPVFGVVGVLAVLFPLVLGVRSMTDEFRYGTIVPTMLTTRSRNSIVASKAVTQAFSGAIVGLSVGLAMTGVAIAWVTHMPSHDAIRATGVVRIVGGSAAAGAGLAALGAGLGAVVRHQLAGVVGSILWFLFAEDMIAASIGRAAEFLPANAVRSLIGFTSDDTIARPQAILVLACWTLAATAAGALLVAHRDVKD